MMDQVFINTMDQGFKDNGEVIRTIALLLSSGLIVRQAVLLAGQSWIRTYSHSITILLLPVITYVISSAISGNIALSLGMVGALSIVRFRNPVKSPFELVIYFLMITCGIAASVKLYWLYVLVITVFGVIFVIKIIDELSIKLFNHDLFTASFAEGNTQATLEIQSSTSIQELENSRNISAFTKDEEGFVYYLTSSKKQSLLEESARWTTDARVLRVQFANS